MEIPTNASINQSRLDRLRERLNNQLETLSAEETSEQQAMLSEILQRVAQERSTTPEQLALAALQMAVGDQPLLVHDDESWLRQQPPLRDGRRGDRFGDRFSDRDRGPRQGNGQANGQPRRGPREQAGPPEDHMDRFRVEVGWRDRIKPGNIVGAIANESGLNGRSIGRIQIFDTHSLVDLPKGMPEEVFQNLKQLKVLNRELQITRVRP
jgi:ATP-dependent RNA helicase DeaD